MRFATPFARLFAVVLALTVATAMVPDVSYGTSEAGPTPTLMTVVDLPGSFAPSTAALLSAPAGTLCVNCQDCDTFYHETDAFAQEEPHQVTWPAHSSSSHACYSVQSHGECADYYGACGTMSSNTGIVVPLDDILDDVRNATGNELQLLIDEFPETVRYNVDRVAIQVIGCDGTVVAHLPVRTLHTAAAQ